MALTSVRTRSNAFFCFAILLAFGCTPLWAKTLVLGTEYASEFQKAEPTYSPEPEISAELKEQCFKSCCIAKFFIGKDGKTTVHLVSTTGSPDVDEIALKALRHWKFKPAARGGEAVEVEVLVGIPPRLPEKPNQASSGELKSHE